MVLMIAYGLNNDPAEYSLILDLCQFSLLICIMLKIEGTLAWDIHEAK